MVRSNLAVLLAERNLKISKVSADTGISRTTLTALTSNYSKGIQFDTLNALCMYLKTQPEQLISFVPVDFRLWHCNFVGNHVPYRDNQLTVDLVLYFNGKNIDCKMTGSLRYTVPKGRIGSVTINLSLPPTTANETIMQSNLALINAFKQLPVPFLRDLEYHIQEQFVDLIYGERLPDDDYDYKLSWPDEFAL